MKWFESKLHDFKNAVLNLCSSVSTLNIYMTKFALLNNSVDCNQEIGYILILDQSIYEYLNVRIKMV